MRRFLGPGLAVLVSACLLVPGLGAVMPPSTLQLQTTYPSSSWAIGVVVPEGTQMVGGGSVSWGGTTNVTVSLALPDIDSPDGIVYAILSVMTSDGSVLQAAAGALPNGTGWLGFAWSVQGASSLKPSYQWVLNASGPEMSPLSNVSISIFRTSGLWDFRVSDADTGSSVEKAFPSGPAPALRVGDQEVFALESYSRTSATFRDMGNLTLYSILLDGNKVTGGCYLYSGWDPVHNPLFVVGSSGSSPPTFINAGEGPAGSFFWDFAGVWGVQDGTFASLAEIVVVVGVAGALTLGGVGFWLARKKSDLVKTPGQAS